MEYDIDRLKELAGIVQRAANGEAKDIREYAGDVKAMADLLERLHKVDPKTFTDFTTFKLGNKTFYVVAILPKERQTTKI